MTVPARSIFIILTGLIALGLCTLGAKAADQGSTITIVELKSTVRLSADTQLVTIGDLATVLGPQADAIKELTIDSAPSFSGEWISIGQSTIRDLIDQSQSVLAGAVIVRGGDVSITLRAKKTQPDQSTPHTASRKANTHEGPVLKDHIKGWIYSRLRTQADTTRIRFDNRFNTLLNTPTSDRIVELTEIGRSAKMHVRFAIYEQDTIIAQGTLYADVEIKRSVLVAKRQIRRRELIDQSMTTIETRWLASTEPIIDPKTSAGLESKTTIQPGKIIMQSMLIEPIIIKRGQLVSAKCIIGQTIVTKVVRAKESGKIGDIIELESKDRKSQFTAKVVGPGRVLIVNPATINESTQSGSQSEDTK